MIALWLLVGYAALALVTWIFFCAVMMLKQRRADLPPVAKFVGWCVEAIGLILDAAFNLASSAPFLDAPHEWLFTDRIKRLQFDAGWRGSQARWYRDNALDCIDPGHCNV